MKRFSSPSSRRTAAAAWLLALLMLLPAGSAAQRLKVGLVLGGGGAKGAAEVGVLQAIEEAGLPIDYIAGTSIGSIVGGLYSYGYRAAFLDSMFRSQQWTTLLSDRNVDYKHRFLKKKHGTTYLFGFPIAGRKKRRARGAFKLGAVEGDHIVALLDSLTANSHYSSFDRLPIPFRCVATDIVSRREVVLSSGSLALAMRASMAIPGVFKAVNLDTLCLLDGGMLNNLPVDVVRAMGADVVIAVDLSVNKRPPRNKEWKDRKGVGRIIDWVVTRPDLKKYNANRAQIDLYINPPLEGYSATSFKPEKISRMIEIGREAGRAALSDLKALARRVKASAGHHRRH